MDSSCALTESGQEVPVIMDGTAIPITDPGLASSLGPQIERAAGAGQHPPNMRARPRPRGDHRTHQVARLVAEMHLLPLPMADGKAMLIDAAHLPITLSGGFEQRFRLGQDACQHVWFLVQEILDEVRALLDVTRLAGQGEVAHTMRAASCAAEDVLNLQGNILCPAVGASPPPLCEQVFPRLIAHAFPLVVLGACDLRVLHGLHIELDQFHADRLNGAQTPQAPYPGEHVGNPAFQRGRKPPFSPGTLAVVEARLAVPRETGASLASHATPGIYALLDAGSPMAEFCRPHHFPARVIDQGQPARLRPWIEFEPQGRHHRCVYLPLEDEGKGVSSVNSGLALFEQQAGPTRMHRV